MLLVLNPFRDLKLTTPDQVLFYRKASPQELRTAQPHVFAVCSRAMHYYMRSDEGNLSFVISGESGAGKTETTKHIMSFFTDPGEFGEIDLRSKAIMSANPVMEAFGNAMTVRNNN